MGWRRWATALAGSGETLVRTVVVVVRLWADIGAEGVSVQNGQVVEVEVRIESQLPVGTLHCTTVEHVPSLETELFEHCAEVTEENVDVEGLFRVKNRPDEAGAFANGEFLQAEVRRVDFAELFAARHADERTFVVEYPAVIRARQSQRSVGPLGENRTTVRARVEKGPGDSVAAADDENVDAGNVESRVAAGLADLALCSNDQRQATEDLGLLSLEVFGVGVSRRGNRHNLVGDGSRSGCAVSKEVLRQGNQVSASDFVGCGTHGFDSTDRDFRCPRRTTLGVNASTRILWS
jgi:hypothetical protein